MDWIDLNTVLINPPCFEKLDTGNGKFKDNKTLLTRNQRPIAR